MLFKKWFLKLLDAYPEEINLLGWDLTQEQNNEIEIEKNQVWQFNPLDPFHEKSIVIINDYKNKFVQYRYKDSDMFFSIHEMFFRIGYRLIGHLK